MDREPQSLADLRAEAERREEARRAQTNGMRVVQNAPRQEPEGFDAETVWTFPYNLNPYVDAKGHIPPPTQEMLDTFERDMSKLMVEYEEAANVEAQAQRDIEQAQESTDDTETIAVRRMAEVDQALEEKRRAMGRMKEITAKLCQGSPSREELDGLPEYVFQRFAEAVGRKINPEV